MLNPCASSLTVLADAAPSSNTTNVLDFGGLTPAIVVVDGADLTLVNITLAGVAPQTISNPDSDQRLRAAGLGSWPSLIVEPGCQVDFNIFFLDSTRYLGWAAGLLHCGTSEYEALGVKALQARQLDVTHHGARLSGGN